MNRRRWPNANRRSAKRRPSERGQSAVEMALGSVVLVVLLLVTADFGRLFYVSVGVANAARAGAQYGSKSLATAADSSGMITAAKQDATNLSGVNVTAAQCTCVSGTSVTSCPSSYCTYNPAGTYVQVTVSTTFKTIVNYPLIPSSATLTREAVMEVQQ
jgi:Flp pilus assembly protein TadG